MRLGSLRTPIWLQKSRPKLIHDALEAQGPPRSAPGSLRNHKRHAMEPKLSPGPSKSTRWLPQGFHKGAPDTHRTPKMESQITPELPKWSLAQGFQNDTEINESKIQPNKPTIGNQTGSNMEPLEPNFDSLLRPNICKKRCHNEANPKEGGRRCVAVRRLRLFPTQELPMDAY